MSTAKRCMVCVQCIYVDPSLIGRQVGSQVGRQLGRQVGWYTLAYGCTYLCCHGRLLRMTRRRKMERSSVSSIIIDLVIYLPMTLIDFQSRRADVYEHRYTFTLHMYVTAGIYMQGWKYYRYSLAVGRYVDRYKVATYNLLQCLEYSCCYGHVQKVGRWEGRHPLPLDLANPPATQVLNVCSSSCMYGILGIRMQVWKHYLHQSTVGHQCIRYTHSYMRRVQLLP